MRGSGAPVISMDGQVILFVDESAFAPDEFYAVQPVTVLPSPPEWATVVGKGYRVLATDDAPDLSTASINFTYMGEEVATGEEPWLRGVWESNVNVLTDDEPDICNPLTGAYPLRTALCKVYKVKKY